MNKIKSTIIYPWLSIWIHPRKTLRYMLRFPNIITISLLFILILFINLGDSTNRSTYEIAKMILEIFHVFLEVLGLYLTIWLVKKERNLKKSITVLVLSFFPFFVYVLAVSLGLDLEGDILKYILFIWLLWYLILSLILIQEAFHLSKIKTIMVIVLSGLIGESLYYAVVYSFYYYSNPFIG